MHTKILLVNVELAIAFVLNTPRLVHKTDLSGNKEPVLRDLILDEAHRISKDACVRISTAKPPLAMVVVLHLRSFVGWVT